MPMVFNRLCSQWRRRRLLVPQSSPSFNAAVGLGTEPEPPSSIRLTATPLLQIDGELKHPYIRWVRRCGCLQRIYLF
ncbi:hypothetical protein LDENG_00052020, partial [Lucifuga dentata]